MHIGPLTRPSLIRVCASALGLFFGFLLIMQNRALRERLSFAQHARSSSSAPVDRVAVGDSVLRLSFSDGAGVHVDGRALVATGASVLFFFRTTCDHCQAMIPRWADFASLRGLDGIVFVQCDPGTLASYSDPGLHGVTVVRLSLTKIATSKFPSVPLILSVNRCGIVTGVFTSVDTLAAALPRLSEQLSQ